MPIANITEVVVDISRCNIRWINQIEDGLSSSIENEVRY